MFYFSIKTKLFLILSIVMGAVLALQFYFFNRAQEKMLEEMSHFTRSFNVATDSYFLALSENLTGIFHQKKVPGSIPLPPGMRRIGDPPDKEEGNAYLERIPGNNFRRNRKPFFPQRPLLSDQRIVKIWHQLKGMESEVILQSQNLEDFAIPDMIKVDQEFEAHLDKTALDSDTTNQKKPKTLQFIGNAQSDSVFTFVKKIDIDLRSVDEDSSGKKINSPAKQARDNHQNKPEIFTFQIPDFTSPDGPRLIRYNFNAAKMEQALISTRNRNIIITLLLYLASIGVILFVSRRFLKPIGSLKNSFDNVVRGDLNSLVPENSRDEIGDLTHSFNYMVNELKKNREKEIILQRKERLASVGQLAAGVAHEIKNPLNSINLTLEHLNDKFINKKEPQAQKYFQTIQQEIKRLDNIVNNFLSFVRTESLLKQNTDVNALILGIIHLFSREMAIQNINFIPAFDRNFIQTLDAERFRTVLMNIILNAIQAMPTGGTLTITTDSKAKTIVINDDGIGMAKSEIENIFDIFYTTKSSGTGLGMPTAYKIVKAHGGDIFVDSQPLKGTRVEIRL